MVDKQAAACLLRWWPPRRGGSIIDIIDDMACVGAPIMKVHRSRM
jgi:hypothetical protein